MRSPIKMRNTMANLATAPTAVHQLPPCIMALVSRPHYKCLIHPTNRSIMILVATATVTVVMENINTGEWQERFIELSGRQLTNFFDCHTIRHNKNGDRHHQQQQSSYADRSYSLPRTMIQPHNQTAGSYYTQDRRNRQSSQNPNGSNHPHNYHRQPADRSNGTDTPDFYFMPSQRKYSGEVVRVYVDYNKDPK